MSTTPNNKWRSPRFPRIARKHHSGAKDLDSNPDLQLPVSEPGPTSHSTISMPEPQAADLASVASSCQEVKEIDFAELKDGTLVELAEDSRHSGRTCLAAWKDGQVRFLDRLEQDGHVFVPLARKDEVLGRLRLPSAAMPYGSVRELLRGLESFISQCVSVDEKFLPVLADFVLSTWFVDRFSVAPYLSVVGLPQSGKTTLLKALGLVCRRSLLVADITSAGFYRACTRFIPTMLIDETATVANARTLRHILRSGTTRDVVAVRRDGTFHSYGAKVITWLEPPNDPALNSRCILIPMFESKSMALLRTDEPNVQERASELQAQLLRFRLDNYRNVQPAPIPGDETLRPRSRDILRALSAARTQEAQRSQRLLKILQDGGGVVAEPLSSEQNAILRTLFWAIHLRQGFSVMRIGSFTQAMNAFLREMGENLRLQPRKVGAVLTSLGFSNRRRTNSGWFISLDRPDAEKLHQLAACYGLEGFWDKLQTISPDDCDLCQASGLNRKSSDSGPDAHGGKSEDVALRETLRAQISST